MQNKSGDIHAIQDYISAFPPEVQERLNALYKLIREEAPEAGEKIGYGMPTFTLNGNLVHFAAYKNHIGFYPAPSGIEAFQQELAGYKTSKGAIQFPLKQPMPYELIRAIVASRVAANRAKQ